MRLAIIDSGHAPEQAAVLAEIRERTGAEPLGVVKTLMYRPDLFGLPFSEELDRVMRGPSDWSAGERELFAGFTSLLQRVPILNGLSRRGRVVCPRRGDLGRGRRGLAHGAAPAGAEGDARLPRDPHVAPGGLDAGRREGGGRGRRLAAGSSRCRSRLRALQHDRQARRLPRLGGAELGAAAAAGPRDARGRLRPHRHTPTVASFVARRSKASTALSSGRGDARVSGACRHGATASLRVSPEEIVQRRLSHSCGYGATFWFMWKRLSGS